MAQGYYKWTLIYCSHNYHLYHLWMSIISPLIHLILPLFINEKSVVRCYSDSNLHLSVNLLMLDCGGGSVRHFLVIL